MVGTSAKAARTASDPSVLMQTNFGLQTFPMVEEFMKTVLTAESTVVCLSFYPEILLENPRGPFHPFACFSKLAGTQKL